MTRNYGISIGVNDYKYHNNNLKYAKSDAEMLANFLRKDAKFDRVWLLSDDSLKFSRESITPDRTSLRGFFRDRFEVPFMSAEDSLWLFFSGHGIQHKGVDYVLPIDGDTGDPEQTCISLDWIVQRIRRSGAGEIVLIVDICRTEGRKGLVSDGTEYKGITTIFSCEPYESSWEIGAPIYQGSFTHVLVKDLKRQLSELPSTIAETETSLKREVARLNREYGREIQNPRIRCESAIKANGFLFSPSFLKQRALVIGGSESLSVSRPLTKKTGAKKRPSSHVTSLKKAALEAEEAKKTDLAKSLWEKVIKADASERDSYILAITRITEASLLQSFRSTSRQAQDQSDEQLSQREGNSGFIQLGIADRVDSLKQLTEIQSLGGLEEYRYDYQLLGSTCEDTQILHGSTYSLTETVDSLGIEMVVVQGGSFLMGSSERRPRSSELPRHEVKISSFLMSKYVITKQQWKVVAKQPQVNRTLKLRSSRRGGNYYPAVEISWHEAVEFCDRLTKISGYDYRLPTEAEWEYACRAGSTTSFHFGDRINKNVAQYDSDYATDVRQFPYPNAFGLYNMHGDVWEWCVDHWHSNYHSAPTDGTAWLGTVENQHRIQRGGSWRNEPALCRSAYRASDQADSSKSSSTGFRIIRPL